MSVEYICDGCGKREPGIYNGRNWFKPDQWYVKNWFDGIKTTELIACSRECVEKVSKATGVNAVVLPI